MAKIVSYTGPAQRRIVRSVDLAQHGIISPDLIFSQERGFFQSLPDVVAVFLLSLGDFVSYEGETLADIWQHNAAPEASPEVLGVQLGGGPVLTGVVEVPAGGDASTAALRELGTTVGKALPGDDSRVAGAVQASSVPGTNRVFVRNNSGDITGIELEENELVMGTDAGIGKVTVSGLGTLIETEGIGVGVADLTDVNLVGSSNPGWYLAATPSEGQPYAFRPLPTFGGGGGGGVEGERSGVAQAFYQFVDEKCVLDLTMETQIEVVCFLPTGIVLDEILLPEAVDGGFTLTLFGEDQIDRSTIVYNTDIKSGAENVSVSALGILDPTWGVEIKFYPWYDEIETVFKWGALIRPSEYFSGNPSASVVFELSAGTIVGNKDDGTTYLVDHSEVTPEYIYLGHSGGDYSMTEHTTKRIIRAVGSGEVGIVAGFGQTVVSASGNFGVAEGGTVVVVAAPGGVCYLSGDLVAVDPPA